MRSLYSVFIAIWACQFSVSHDVSRVLPHTAIANHTLKRESEHHPVTIGYHVDASTALFPNVAFDFLVAPVTVNQHASPSDLHAVVIILHDRKTVLAEVVHQLFMNGAVCVVEPDNLIPIGVNVAWFKGDMLSIQGSLLNPTFDLRD